MKEHNRKAKVINVVSNSWKYCIPLLLFVLVKPFNVTILESNQPLSVDRQYKIICLAMGSRPHATITWWLNNTPLIDFSEEVSLWLIHNYTEKERKRKKKETLNCEMCIFLESWDHEWNEKEKRIRKMYKSCPSPILFFFYHLVSVSPYFPSSWCSFFTPFFLQSFLLIVLNKGKLKKISNNNVKVFFFRSPFFNFTSKTWR